MDKKIDSTFPFCLASKYMLRIVILLPFITTLWAGDLFNYDPRFQPALPIAPSVSGLTTSTDWLALQPDSIAKDSLGVQGVVYPGKSLLFSLILPGSGQFYNKAPWWKTALFAGVEVVGISSWWYLTHRADDIRLDFEEFADEHWSLRSWVATRGYFEPILFAEQTIDSLTNIYTSTHHLTVIVNGSYLSSQELYFHEEWGYDTTVTVLRDRDFYENIGKYDQFLGGWDDAYADDGTPLWWKKAKHVGDSTEYIYMTNNKKKYLNMRYDSNQLLTMAKFAVSAVMLNHIFSAMEAVFYSQRKSRPKPVVKTEVGLIYDRYAPNGIGGVRLSFLW